MMDLGKRSVIGVLVDAVDDEAAVARIVDAAKAGRPYAVTALAVHGVMTGVHDRHHLYRLNHLDLVTPDGQPVRWVLNGLHKAGLHDKVPGPRLMFEVCRRAEREGLSIFLYGSDDDVLGRLQERLHARFPDLKIAGTEPSKFRRTTEEEKKEIVARIRASGAALVFVGLGCPRQEVFVSEYRDDLSMPLVAVGAAFDYHAGLLIDSPAWVQRAGLQWLHRLLQEPRRLWKRYLLLNPEFLARWALQRSGLRRPDPNNGVPPRSEERYG
jgi:N-acetylglucosaminyldiphosphoundecaprenol N-acetyl-beta-D-mannosaminyltransferase